MKIVKLDILVPDSDYCFDGKECCPHFNNEGGHGQCELNIGRIADYSVEKGYKKPKECLELLG
jgi:hypothetical protein